MECQILLLLTLATAVCVAGRRRNIVYGEHRAPENYACNATTLPQDMTSFTGTFTSPGRPLVYPNDAWCEWSINYTAPEHDGRVMLSFSYFQLEDSYDYVDVYDGADGSGVQLASYTGYEIPDYGVVSTLPGMLVRFTSDRFTVDRGFDAMYTADSACFGGEHSSLSGSGTFTSTYYPSALFQAGDDCRWRIGDATQAGNIIFDYFFVGTNEESIHCPDAHLWYIDSTGQDTYLCGTTMPADIQFTGEIDFHFNVPAGYIPNEKEGFSARYSTYPIK